MSATRIAAALFICLLVSSARADNTTARAKELYDVGLTDYNLGHYEDALVAFEQAYRIRHDAAFLFNIGQCQRQLRRYDDAERSYRAYLRESTDIPASTRDQVQKLIAEMEKARDEERAKLPPPGTQPPAEAAKTSTPSVGAAAAVAASPVYRDVGRSKRIAGLAVAASGVALVGAGIAFAVLSKQAGDSAYRPASNVYDPSADERQKNYRAADIACFVVGGAAVVAGAALWGIGHRERHKRVDVGAAVGRGFAATSLQVKF